MIFDRSDSHLHSGVHKYVDLALRGRSIEEVMNGKKSCVVEHDFGVKIGVTSCIPLKEDDCNTIYAIRKTKHGVRPGLSRIHTSMKPSPTSKITIVIIKRRDGDYTVISAWCGSKAEPEPYDKNATAGSLSFWQGHALICTPDEIVLSSARKSCPWDCVS
jgi:hypothetical protein